MSPEPEPEIELPSHPSMPSEPDIELPGSPSPTPEPPEQPSRKRKLRLIVPSPPPSPEGDTPLPSPGGGNDLPPPEEEPDLLTSPSWSRDLTEGARKKPRTRTTPITSPTNPYRPPTPYAKAMARLMDVNQVRELQRAEILFRSARHPIHGSAFADACKKELDEILKAGPSEAIEAKCYMMLARMELSSDALSRVTYVKNAVYAWKRVIGRKGISKFPIAKARKGLALAQELLAHAEEALAQNESSDIL